MNSPSLPASQAFRLAWLIRWLVVLVLIWDQVGSPLHHHEHDSGIDSRSGVAAAVLGPANVMHLEAPDELARIVHSVVAVRSLELGSLLPGDVPQHDVICANGYAPTVDADVHRQVVPTVTPAQPPAWRSLPPAGRAPPLST